MTDFDGNLFELMAHAENYIMQHINVGMRLDGLYRVDVPEINQTAFREAIINAFCHRDYFVPQEINVAVFKDRVEIRNPGELYSGLTLKDILNKRISKRRNPLIADILHRIHLVEKWGTGIEKIRSLEPGVVFEVFAGFFSTSFKRGGTQKIQPKTSQKPAKNQPKTSQKPAKEERQKLILSRIERGDFTKRSFAGEIGMNKSTIEADLEELGKNGK